MGRQTRQDITVFNKRYLNSHKLWSMYCSSTGEYDHHGAEVGGSERASLEAAHEGPSGSLATARPHLGSSVGRRPSKERDDRQGRHQGGPGRNGSGGVLENGKGINDGYESIYVVLNLGSSSSRNLVT